MANFNALSSGFVFGTVLLLLVVITVYPTGAASCNSSEVMLFKSSPLKEAVEEVTKDQGTTTEIAGEDDHEIRGRVLQASSATKGVKLFFNLLGKASKQYQQPSPGVNVDVKIYYEYLDGVCNKFKAYCVPSNNFMCSCDWDNFPQTADNGNTCAYGNFYCCGGTSNGICTQCCKGETPYGMRTNIWLPSYVKPYSSSGFSSPGSSSSGSHRSVANVVMTVIAMFTIIPSMFYLLLI